MKIYGNSMKNSLLQNIQNYSNLIKSTVVNAIQSEADHYK